MYFQNVFDSEFRGTVMTSDRQYTPTYKLGANVNRSDLMLAWNPEPFDMSANNTLTINYAMDFSSPNFASLAINVAGATTSATTATEVVTALNSNAVFASLFVAAIQKQKGENYVYIRCLRPKHSIRVYISNTSAEHALAFNLKAPVAEMPSYFEKYTIQQAASYPELGPALLLKLDEADSDDQQVITAAGLTYSSPKKDWQLLAGRDESFMLTKRLYSGSTLTTEIIYPAGARAGDMARKINYVYSGSNLTEQTEVPYILTGSDLITPP